MYVSTQDNHIVKQYIDENIQRILFEFLIVRINGNSEKYNFFRIMRRIGDKYRSDWRRVAIEMISTDDLESHRAAWSGLFAPWFSLSLT